MRRALSSATYPFCCISIHAPTWGATITIQWTFLLISQFQSTHLREVRRSYSFEFDNDWIISIHAPTWGATVIRGTINLNRAISIHAPTWGATSYYRDAYGLSVFQSTHLREVRRGKRVVANYNVDLFQSTHLREVRPKFFSSRFKTTNISIHAPTWGATITVLLVIFCWWNFNPRTYVRCDNDG